MIGFKLLIIIFKVKVIFASIILEEPYFRNTII